MGGGQKNNGKKGGKGKVQLKTYIYYNTITKWGRKKINYTHINLKLECGKKSNEHYIFSENGKSQYPQNKCYIQIMSGLIFGGKNNFI